MKNHTRSKEFLRNNLTAIALLSSPLMAQAAPITWEAATDPIDFNDVSLIGTLVEAFNAGSTDTATTETVNGVLFTGTADLLSANSSNDSFAGDTGDLAYNALLSSFDFGGGTGIDLTIGGGSLIAGESYQIQVWHSQAGGASTRVMTFGDGVSANTVDLIGTGQYALGSFIASDATQTLSLATNGFGNCHMTAYQLRQVAAIPPNVVLSTTVDPVAAAYTVDVTFEQDVTGLTASDFIVSNGTASGVLPSAGPASAYTVTITPASSGFVTVALPSEIAQDSSSNGNLASNILTSTSVPAGSEQASVTLSTSAGEPVMTSYTVDVVFDESIDGLEASDFNVVNGTATDVFPATGPATNYTVTINPAADGLVEVTLPSNSALDTDDALPNLVSNTLVTDFLPPTAPTLELVSNEPSEIISGPITLDAFFSEDVTGLDASDFSVTNGVASNLFVFAANDYSIDITPTAPGLVSITLPTGTVLDVDGDNLSNPQSNTISLNFLPAGTYTSGLLDLSGRDTTGLGDGESGSFADSPKIFNSISDLSLNDIPWTDGVNSGTFDLTLQATSNTGGIRRGGLGAFGVAIDAATPSTLVGDGQSLTLDALTVSDLKGDLLGATISNIRFVAVYLGNFSGLDAGSLNGLSALGAAGGATNENMRNTVGLVNSAVIVGESASADGFSINGIEISFEATRNSVQIVSCGFNPSNGFEINFSGLDTSQAYELWFSPDLATAFAPIAGTSKTPASSIETFTDPSPALPGKGFYRLFISL